MNDFCEQRRRAIVLEVAALMPKRQAKMPYMFTAAEMAQATGEMYQRVMEHLKRLASNGVLCSDTNGFDPDTGRRVTLFWRLEDEPRGADGSEPVMVAK